MGTNGRSYMLRARKGGEGERMGIQGRFRSQMWCVFVSASTAAEQINSKQQLKAARNIHIAHSVRRF